MATFTITIKNHSNTERQFLLFQDMPEPTNAPQGTVFSNVYQQSPLIQSDNSASTTFSMQQDYYAMCGTEVSAPNGRVRVSTSDYTKATLGPGGTIAPLTTINRNGQDPAFNQAAAAGRTSPAKGGFSIETDHSFTFPNPKHIYIGCGAPATDGSVIPIQTYKAKPGLTTELFPKSKYYVDFGDYQPGTAVQRVEIGDVLQVDFTGATIPTATFTLNSHGAYDADPSVKTNGVNWYFGRLSNQ